MKSRTSVFIFYAPTLEALETIRTSINARDISAKNKDRYGREIEARKSELTRYDSACAEFSAKWEKRPQLLKQTKFFP